MEHLPLESYSGNMFDHGVVYRFTNPNDNTHHTKDTLRAFIGSEYREWNAGSLKAHHIDSAKLYKWLLYGVTEGSTEGIARRYWNLLAVFRSAEGSSNAFEIDNEGSLRVFLQRAVNAWHHHRMCQILFFDTLPAGAIIYKEDNRVCLFDARIKLEDGRKC